LFDLNFSCILHIYIFFSFFIFWLSYGTITVIFSAIHIFFSPPHFVLFLFGIFTAALALAEVAPSVVRSDTGVAPSRKYSVAVFGLNERNRGKCQAQGLGYRLNFGIRVGLFRFGSLGDQR